MADPNVAKLTASLEDLSLKKQLPLRQQVDLEPEISFCFANFSPILPRSDDLKALQKQYFVSKFRLHEEKMKLIAAKMEMVKNQGEFYRNMTNALAQTRKMMENEQ